MHTHLLERVKAPFTGRSIDFSSKWWTSYVNLQTVTKEVSVARLSDTDHMTEHAKSNVYISAFITGYARMAFHKDALEVLQEKVFLFTTEVLGLRTSELKAGEGWWLVYQIRVCRSEEVLL